VKEQETIDRFITLRVQGLSYARIGADIGVSKPTLIRWSRQYRFELQNQHALAMDELRNRILGASPQRVDCLVQKLAKVEGELRNRDLSKVSTTALFNLSASLRRQITHETACRFIAPVKDIPAEEYVEEVQEWNL
jgi:transposase-like protein